MRGTPALTYGVGATTIFLAIAKADAACNDGLKEFILRVFGALVVGFVVIWEWCESGPRRQGVGRVSEDAVGVWVWLDTSAK